MNDYSKGLVEAGFEIIRPGNRVVVRNGEMTIIGHSDNTLVTAYGVLCEECYGVSTQDDYIAFDIGLNIGLASLYFARNTKIKHIYGFEPFKGTYRQALINIKNNENLAEKITAYNFGLGAGNKKVTVAYNPEKPGSMSTVADTFAGRGVPETVEIKDVAEVFPPILKKHQERVLLKMDCEGGEGEIISRLAETGVLSSMDVILMEWHFNPPHALVDILTRNGFITFFEHVVRGKLGFIRAVNQADRKPPASKLNG